MTEFIIKKLPYDLSSHAGLAFIGKYLKSININALTDPAFSVRSGVINSDILKSYLGLLCLGKSDFDAIKNFRRNDFFIRALGLNAVPSSPTLRQRLSREIAFIIKWNPRRVPVHCDPKNGCCQHAAWMIHRSGKRECIWQDNLDLAQVGSEANPVRHAAKRRRIKTVMQEMMFSMNKHAGRWILGLGQNDGGFAVFERHYGHLNTA